MSFDAATVQGLWKRTSKQQRIGLGALVLILFIMSGGFAAILALLWGLISVIVYVFNSNAGFFIASSAVPALIQRFGNKNSSTQSGMPAFSVPRRTDTSESARQAALNNAMSYLQNMVGLEGVKDQIKKYKAVMEVNVRRQKLNGADNQQILPSLNLVFLGNSGTGKTTVARVWGDILYGLGIIDSGHTVEVDRSHLVAKYIGQTASLTTNACRAALDGVLFIDEAYSLARPDTDNDFGHEAIETIMKFMEDFRGRISIIVAGYDKQMIVFLDSNPGLKSRFPRKIAFQDYSSEQLLAIFVGYANYDKMSVPDGTLEFLETFFKQVKKSGNQFGNARFIRNFYDSCKESHALRLSESATYSNRELNTFDLQDLKTAILVPT